MTTNWSIPTGAPSLEVDQYLKHLQEEYLHSYISAGGGSVKFVAADADTTTGYFSKRLAAVASGGDYLHVRLDAAQTRMQFIEEVFFAISRQIDWMALALDFLRWAYRSLDIPPEDNVPAVVSVQVRRVAETNGLHAGELYRTIRRFLEHTILGETILLHQFQVAMLRLCQSLLNWTQTDGDEPDIVLRWLRGHSVPVVQLRTVGLYSRIARHQARYVFSSLTRWVRLAGKPGIILELDLTRVGVGRRPQASARRGYYYARAAAMDTFEILRQFVDTADELQSSLVVVTLPHQMVTDTHRGLPAYHALYLRVADEVYDQDRANPFGILVRVVRN